MRRGVVFTLDALVAVVIAMLALAAITHLLSLRTGEWYKELALYNTAQDFLTSREKDDTLASIFNQTDANATSTLNNSMALQIPANMVAQINITICNYTSQFVCGRNFTIGSNGSSQTASVVRRVFADTANEKYGIAVMEVWYR